MSRLGAVLVLTALSLLGTGPAGAADDPSAAPADGLISGVEGSKAALVRIEVSATAEIAHIDHSTGDVHVARGRYEVPIRSGTGVFTSSDGVIATTGSTLIVTEDQVVVYAANRLFQEQMRTALVGNDGDLYKRAQAADPYWAPHLQHCYNRVEHCILFFVPQYKVVPFTQQPTSTPAELLRAPGDPGDVGLLRISGGGGTPTAELAPAGQPFPAEALLAGFTGPPAPDVAPGQMDVRIDAATGALAADGDLAGVLGAGLSGGPVLDPVTGQVAGLTTSVDGTPTLIPAQRLQDALAAAGTPPASSEFDPVFRRGIDHMSSGHMGASAENSFREALTYYDSALAGQYLRQATASADDMAPAPAAAAGARSDGRPLGWWALGGAALLLVLGLGILLRRRRAARPPDAGAPGPDGQPVAGTPAAPRPGPPRGTEPSSDRTSSPPPVAVAAARPAAGNGAHRADERTRLRQSPAGAAGPLPNGQPRPAFCSDCGGRLRDRARFCGMCGSPVR